MRIGVDIDGVVADHVRQFCREYHRTTGVKLRPQRLPTWDICPPGADEDLLSLLDERLYSSSFLSRMDSIYGAPEGIRDLFETGHEVIIVTHRPTETHKITEKWLRRHDIPFSGFPRDVPRNKGELNLDVLIDDYHGNVVAARQEGVDAFLYLQPWNERYAAEIPRDSIVTSWQEFQTKLESRG